MKPTVEPEKNAKMNPDEAKASSAMPQHIKTLDEATAAFLSYSPPSMGGNYSLDRMQELMMRLGNPQDKLCVIHIAGTSGKTSTAYFIRNLLEAAGKRTGLTVSPHIVSINERVQVDGLPLAEEKFLGYTNRFFQLLAGIPLQPTYFELLVALAYWVFVEENVDYTVIETGLGGLLDGTNVVTRADKICVITDIGLDHTEILGNTLSQIAVQKAGIIQPHNRVILHRQARMVMKVIEAAVKGRQATLAVVEDTPNPAARLWADQAQNQIRLPDFQHRNWTLAIAAYRDLMARDNLPPLTAAQYKTASQNTPPGRWERYRYRDKTILLDGAHNPQKLEALTSSLRTAGIVQAAVLANFVEAPARKISNALVTLQPVATRLIIPEFTVGQDVKGRRSVSAGKLAEQAKTHHFPGVEVCPGIPDALQKLLDSPDDILLITGSLYLVSLIRPYVQAAATLPNP